MKKLITLAFALIIIAKPTAQALIDVTYKNSHLISEGLTFTEMTGSNSSGVQSVNYFEYTPNTNVSPIVTYGNFISGSRLNINSMRNILESKGYNVLGGINGDFYTLNTGVPSGIVMQDSIIYSSDSWQYTVAFKEDGSAFISRPGMSFSVTNGSTSTKIGYYNKTRTSASAYLLDEYFGNNTNISSSGTNYVLEKVDSTPLTLQTNVKLKVVDIITTSTSTEIASNQMILTIDDNCTSVPLPNYKIGETLTLTATVNDQNWLNATYAIGAGELLLTNSNVVSGLSTGTNPRSAIGIKADGTIIVYEVDGRISSHSNGLTLTQLAEELKALGCVSAVNLDGGGSSSIMAKIPGTSQAVTQNTPSDGSHRSNANFVFFVNTAKAVGGLTNVHLFPESNLVLKNATIKLGVVGTDANFFSTAASGYTFSGDGTFNGNAYTPTTTGLKTVSVNYGTSTASQEINVLSTVSNITVKNEANNTTVSSLSLTPSQTVNLSASSTESGYSVVCDDKSYTWAVTGDIGTITNDGIFTATNPKTTGSITVTYGYKIITIPVTVGIETQSFVYTIQDFEGDFNLLSNHSFESNIVANGNTSLKVSPMTNVFYNTQYDISPYSYVNFKIKTSKADAFFVNFKNSSGTTSSVLVNSLDTNFNSYSVEIPDGFPIFTGFSGAGSDTIYIDQITASHTENDNQGPVISVLTYDKTITDKIYISANIADGGTKSLSASAIEVTLNGISSDFTYLPETGCFFFTSTNFMSGLNRVKISAWDNFGNLSVEYLDFETTSSSTNIFQDTSYNWAKDYINFASNKNIVSGQVIDGVTYFFPQREITRAEFAVVISRFLGLDTSSVTSVSFADSSNIPSWATSHIYAVSNASIMNGSYDGDLLYFRPWDSITRAEAFTVLGRILENGVDINTNTFTDSNQIPSWSSDYFTKLYSFGIIDGYEDNSIKPLNAITRAEVCKLIYSIF